MDKIDRRILAELQSDGNITNLELADKVGLSPSPCARRVKQLEEIGDVQLMRQAALDELAQRALYNPN